MEWQDTGIVLKTHAHGDGKAVVTIYTQEHGRHLGYIRGTRKIGAMLQPGTLVHCTWSARFAEQLGYWKIEPHQSIYSRVFHKPLALAALLSCCAWIDLTTAEREKNEAIYHNLYQTLMRLDQKDAMIFYVQFEQNLLKELGFGLDLSRCAATGQVDELIYVSPRSGCAVSRQAGQAYKDRMLPLPGFLKDPGQPASEEAIQDGLKLIGYFLERCILTHLNKQIPPARKRLESLVKRQNDEQSKNGSY